MPRADGDATPILMLTARVDVPDRIAGLDAGADDYMLKPYLLRDRPGRPAGVNSLASPGS